MKERKKINGTDHREHSLHAQTVSLIFIFCFLQLFVLLSLHNSLTLSIFKWMLKLLFPVFVPFSYAIVCLSSSLSVQIFWYSSFFPFKHAFTHFFVLSIRRWYVSVDFFVLCSGFFCLLLIFSLIWFFHISLETGREIKSVCLWSVKRTFLSGTWLLAKHTHKRINRWQRNIVWGTLLCVCICV